MDIDYRKINRTIRYVNGKQVINETIISGNDSSVVNRNIIISESTNDKNNGQSYDDEEDMYSYDKEYRTGITELFETVLGVPSFLGIRLGSKLDDAKTVLASYTKEEKDLTDYEGYIKGLLETFHVKVSPTADDGLIDEIRLSMTVKRDDIYNLLEYFRKTMYPDKYDSLSDRDFTYDGSFNKILCIRNKFFQITMNYDYHIDHNEQMHVKIHMPHNLPASTPAFYAYINEIHDRYKEQVEEGVEYEEGVYSYYNLQF